MYLPWTKLSLANRCKETVVSQLTVRTVHILRRCGSQVCVVTIGSVMSISFDSIACAQTQHSLMHVNRGASSCSSQFIRGSVASVYRLLIALVA